MAAFFVYFDCSILFEPTQVKSIIEEKKKRKRNRASGSNDSVTQNGVYAVLLLCSHRHQATHIWSIDVSLWYRFLINFIVERLFIHQTRLKYAISLEPSVNCMCVCVCNEINEADYFRFIQSSSNIGLKLYYSRSLTTFIHTSIGSPVRYSNR